MAYKPYRPAKPIGPQNLSAYKTYRHYQTFLLQFLSADRNFSFDRLCSVGQWVLQGDTLWRQVSRLIGYVGDRLCRRWLCGLIGFQVNIGCVGNRIGFVLIGFVPLGFEAAALIPIGFVCAPFYLLIIL